MNLVELSATELRRGIFAKDWSIREVTEAFLRRIAEREPIVQAWEFLDRERVLQQAIALDERNLPNPAEKPLYGLPIAVKDNFATNTMPTGCGTVLHAGQRFNFDAAVVERSQSAGAMILGKTVMTEYATARAGKTTNPHNPLHTPGGSSSGSAAAIAAGMVPLAVGSQTMGSVLRPAAYCGVLGFKPSFGTISRYGLVPVSRELDHVGVFGRTVADLALFAGALAGSDGRDPDCWGGRGDWEIDWECSQQKYCAKPPRLAFCHTHRWDRLQPETQGRLLTYAADLEKRGVAIAPVLLPKSFESFLHHVYVLMCAGLAAHHGEDYDQHREQLSPLLQKLIERGRSESALLYAKARQAAVAYSQWLAEAMQDFDAILTPVTTGTAPFGLEDTGSPEFCALWTLCGLPAISIPVGAATNGLPLAVQLVGKRSQDCELLRIADWLSETCR